MCEETLIFIGSIIAMVIFVGLNVFLFVPEIFWRIKGRKIWWQKKHGSLRL